MFDLIGALVLLVVLSWLTYFSSSKLTGKPPSQWGDGRIALCVASALLSVVAAGFAAIAWDAYAHTLGGWPK